MPKFRFKETTPCYVTWECEVEAPTEDEARELFFNGEHEEWGEPTIGDAMDWLDSGLEVTEVK